MVLEVFLKSKGKRWCVSAAFDDLHFYKAEYFLSIWICLIIVIQSATIGFLKETIMKCLSTYLAKKVGMKVNGCLNNHFFVWMCILLERVDYCKLF